MSAIISWILTTGWMAVIFRFSSQPAENSDKMSLFLTDGILRMFFRLLRRPVEDGTLLLLTEHLNTLVRKVAHSLEYGILGILALSSFHFSKVGGRKKFVFSFLLCVLYAISDEVHQIFVPGRAGRVSDILIDSVGAFIGIYLFKKLLIKK